MSYIKSTELNNILKNSLTLPVQARIRINSGTKLPSMAIDSNMRPAGEAGGSGQKRPLGRARIKSLMNVESMDKNQQSSDYLQEKSQFLQQNSHHSHSINGFDEGMDVGYGDVNTMLTYRANSNILPSFQQNSNSNVSVVELRNLQEQFIQLREKVITLSSKVIKSTAGGVSKADLNELQDLMQREARDKNEQLNGLRQQQSILSQQKNDIEILNDSLKQANEKVEDLNAGFNEQFIRIKELLEHKEQAIMEAMASQIAQVKFSLSQQDQAISSNIPAQTVYQNISSTLQQHIQQNAHITDKLEQERIEKEVRQAKANRDQFEELRKNIVQEIVRKISLKSNSEFCDEVLQNRVSQLEILVGSVDSERLAILQQVSDSNREIKDGLQKMKTMCSLLEDQLKEQLVESEDKQSRKIDEIHKKTKTIFTHVSQALKTLKADINLETKERVKQQDEMIKQEEEKRVQDKRIVEEEKKRVADAMNLQLLQVNANISTSMQQVTDRLGAQIALEGNVRKQDLKESETRLGAAIQLETSAREAINRAQESIQQARAVAELKLKETMDDHAADISTANQKIAELERKLDRVQVETAAAQGLISAEQKRLSDQVQQSAVKVTGMVEVSQKEGIERNRQMNNRSVETLNGKIKEIGESFEEKIKILEGQLIAQNQNIQLQKETFEQKNDLDRTAAIREQEVFKEWRSLLERESKQIGQSLIEVKGDLLLERANSKQLKTDILSSISSSEIVQRAFTKGLLEAEKSDRNIKMNDILDHLKRISDTTSSNSKNIETINTDVIALKDTNEKKILELGLLIEAEKVLQHSVNEKILADMSNQEFDVRELKKNLENMIEEQNGMGSDMQKIIESMQDINQSTKDGIEDLTVQFNDRMKEVNERIQGIDDNIANNLMNNILDANNQIYLQSVVFKVQQEELRSQFGIQIEQTQESISHVTQAIEQMIDMNAMALNDNMAVQEKALAEAIQAIDDKMSEELQGEIQKESSKVKAEILRQIEESKVDQDNKWKIQLEELKKLQQETIEGMQKEVEKKFVDIKTEMVKETDEIKRELNETMRLQEEQKKKEEELKIQQKEQKRLKAEETKREQEQQQKQIDEEAKRKEEQLRNEKQKSKDLEKEANDKRSKEEEEKIQQLREQILIVQSQFNQSDNSIKEIKRILQEQKDLAKGQEQEKKPSSSQQQQRNDSGQGKREDQVNDKIV